MVNFNPGDIVSIKTEDNEYTGTIVQNPDANIIILKLKNGYNTGIDKIKIKNSKIIDKVPAKKVPKKEIKFKKDLPHIAILHTGGTIASKVDYETGGVVTGFSAEDLIEMFPELQEIANITTSKILDIMSEDYRFKHYKVITDAIKKEINNGVKGIIIGHGTDTLAITAAALSFILENLPIPVLLVGAQRSTDRGSTDGLLNLMSAAYFIANTDFSGVAICMHESSSDNFCAIYPATKTKKLHTSRRDAFKAVNDSIIARVDYKNKKIVHIKDYKRPGNKELTIKDKFEEMVAIIKAYPNMQPDLIDALSRSKYKGFVFEGSGLGQAPTNIKENLPNYDSLKKFIDNGGIIVLTSNCIFGEVHPDIYKNCRRLKEIGVIFGKDMLTETAFIKLAWLLGNFKKDDAINLMDKNLRGEISERRLYQEKVI